MDTITVNAPDISCDHCVAAIKEAVSALEGVQSVDASTGTKNVDVTFDGNTTSADAIAVALKDAGYPVQR